LKTMLIEDIKKIKSEKSDLRKFGLSVGMALGLLGWLFWWREKDFYSYFLFVSLMLISLGLIAPAALKPFQKVWMTVAVVIGWFMTRLILSVLFYAVITPIGLISKVSGKEFLDKKFDKHANKKVSSYWVHRKETLFDKNRYEKQF